MTDDELLNEYKQTKDSQLYPLVDARFRRRMTKIALDVLNNDPAADDIVQEVFIKLIESDNTPLESPTYYLYRMVKNHAKNYITHSNSGVNRDSVPLDVFERPEPELGIDELDELPPPERSAHEPMYDDVPWKEKYSQVSRYLDLFPDQTREAVELYYGSGHTVGEVADILSLPPQKTWFLIRDGMEELRKHFHTEENLALAL